MDALASENFFSAARGFYRDVCTGNARRGADVEPDINPVTREVGEGRRNRRPRHPLLDFYDINLILLDLFKPDFQRIVSVNHLHFDVNLGF